MKTFKTLLGIAASIGVLTVSSTSVFGQAQIIYMGENGSAYITPSLPFAYTVATEPVSGKATLEYTLPFAGVAGDLLLTEPNSSQISDVLRFDGNSHVYFFSDLDAGQNQLADVGLPSVYISPNVTIAETGTEGVATSALYIPSAGQPGYKAAGPVAYQIISDVPEPGTAVLGGLCSGLLLVLNSRRQAKRG